MIIGLDFDNTIVEYTPLFRSLAIEKGWLDATSPVRSKKDVRDLVRLLPDGEMKWRDLQAEVYGPRILGAEPFAGVREFLLSCREKGWDVRVVSHKSEYAANDFGRECSLREMALKWFEAGGFFGDEYGLSREKVFFTDTRAEKVARIAALGCMVFVDDLIETFEEEGFPEATRRILFADGQSDFDGAVAADWAEVARLVEEAVHGRLDLCPAACAAIGEPVLSVAVLGGGRNSRVFAAATATRTVVVKYYFRAPGDPRDRQWTEYRALAFLAANGLSCVPAVLHLDREQGFTVLAHVEGERITDDRMREADERDIEAFAERLRALSATPGARELDGASEAFFSLGGVLGNLDDRLARLMSRPGDLPLAAELGDFLENRFIPAFEDLSSRAKVYYRGAGLEAGDELDASERVLSPSDFGLHNCVQSPEGLVFFDFEYFGWDDPAKFVSDFVLHPAQESVGEARYRVAGRLAGLFMDRPGFADRLRALLPLFALKWCMIVLNEFLAEENARRAFAGCGRDHETVLRRQLGLAEAMLGRAVSGDIAARLIQQNQQVR